METLFKQENLSSELPIDGDKDVVLVLRNRDDVHDFYLHLPSFSGDNKNFPPHIGTAIAIAACLYNQDEDFHKLIGEKFDKYGESYLRRVAPEGFKEE